MLATQDLVAGLDARVDQVYAELRQLRGKVNGMRRWEAAQDEQKAPETRQDALGPANVARRAIGAPNVPRRNY